MLDETPLSLESRISSFTSDDPFAVAADLLNVEDEAAAFGRIAAAKSISPPLAIGIFGEWGSGKTFFMRRIYDNVDDLARCDPEAGKPAMFHTDIVQIRFNAWHYIETNLCASLVEYIFTELDRWLASFGHFCETARRQNAGHIAMKAVIGISPTKLFRVVIWPEPIDGTR